MTRPQLQPRGAPSAVSGDYTAAFTLTSFALALLMVRLLCQALLTLSSTSCYKSFLSVWQDVCEVLFCYSSPTTSNIAWR